MRRVLDYSCVDSIIPNLIGFQFFSDIEEDVLSNTVRHKLFSAVSRNKQQSWMIEQQQIAHSSMVSIFGGFELPHPQCVEILNSRMLKNVFILRSIEIFIFFFFEARMKQSLENLPAIR